MYIQCEREEVKIILMKRIKKVVLARQVQDSVGEGKNTAPKPHTGEKLETGEGM